MAREQLPAVPHRAVVVLVLLEPVELCSRVGFVDEAVLETELTSLDPAIQFKSEILTR